MFKIYSSSYIRKFSQRQMGTPNAFENAFGKKPNPYARYHPPNSGLGYNLNVPFTEEMPGDPVAGSDSIGGGRFDRVNPSLSHPYAENGDPLVTNADPEMPFSDNRAENADRPARTEYETGGWKNFVHPDSPLSINRDVFDPSAQRDRNPHGPQGDVGGKTRALGRN